MNFILSDASQEVFTCFPTRLFFAQGGAANTRPYTRIRVTVEGHDGRVICDRGQCLVALSPYVSAKNGIPHASCATVLLHVWNVVALVPLGAARGGEAKDE